LHAAEQLFDAFMTWELIGELQVTDVSLKFFRHFDQNIDIGTYPKGSDVYESLTYAVISWAESAILFLADHTPNNHILPLGFDRTTGEPVGPRGAILSLAAALTVFDVYNGLIPPSWAHGDRSTQRPWNGTAHNDYHGVMFGACEQSVPCCAWGGGG
jgi:glucoamylase